MALEPRRGNHGKRAEHLLPVATDAAAKVPGLVSVLLTPEEVRRSGIGTARPRAAPGATGPGHLVPVHTVLEGTSGTYVFVTRDDRVFTPTPVEVHSLSTDYTYLVTGLSHGDRVVVGGQALLDAESRLRATLAATTNGTSP